MLLIALAIGVVLIVAAIRNTQDALFAALKVDVPAYVTIAAAILAVGAIGFVPGLKPVSRGLVALIFTVLILRNYQQIIAGFQAVSAGQADSAATATAPASSASSPSMANFFGDPFLNDIAGSIAPAVPTDGEPNFVGAF